MQNHFHQQINLYTNRNKIDDLLNEKSHLDSTIQIQDQYHNHPEMLLHEMNLNPESLFVVVMDHSPPKINSSMKYFPDLSYS